MTKRDSEARYCKFCNLGQYLLKLQRFATTAESTPRLTGIPGPRSSGRDIAGRAGGEETRCGLRQRDRYAGDERSISTRCSVDLYEMLGPCFGNTRYYFKDKGD